MYLRRLKRNEKSVVAGGCIGCVPLAPSKMLPPQPKPPQPKPSPGGYEPKLRVRL